MSLNKDFSERMQKAVDQMKEKGQFNALTNHVNFGADAVTLPEGITEESMKQHVDFINETSGQLETATALIAREQHANNDKLSTVDGSYHIGGVTINSQHHLRQQVGGDEWVFGESTTAISYVHSDEQTQWLTEQRETSVAEAAKLFS